MGKADYIRVGDAFMKEHSSWPALVENSAVGLAMVCFGGLQRTDVGGNGEPLTSLKPALEER